MNRSFRRGIGKDGTVGCQEFSPTSVTGLPWHGAPRPYVQPAPAGGHDAPTFRPRQEATADLSPRPWGLARYSERRRSSPTSTTSVIAPPRRRGIRWRAGRAWRGTFLVTRTTMLGFPVTWPPTSLCPSPAPTTFGTLRRLPVPGTGPSRPHIGVSPSFPSHPTPETRRRHRRVGVSGLALSRCAPANATIAPPTLVGSEGITCPVPSRKTDPVAKQP